MHLGSGWFGRRFSGPHSHYSVLAAWYPSTSWVFWYGRMQVRALLGVAAPAAGQGGGNGYLDCNSEDRAYSMEKERVIIHSNVFIELCEWLQSALWSWI
jgi:hypothetical protein